MSWNELTFVECSLLTADKMTRLQANFSALAMGDSGAPPIAVNSILWTGQGSGGSLHVSSGLLAPQVSSLGAVHASSGFAASQVSSLSRVHVASGMAAPETSSLGTLHLSSGWIAPQVGSAGSIHAASGFVGPAVSSFASLEVSSGMHVAGAAPSPPAADTLYLESFGKGWVNFNGQGTIAIRDSFNVTGLTDHGVGDYTVTWDTDFAAADYALAGMGQSTTYVLVSATGGLAAGSVRINTRDWDGAIVDRPEVHIMAFGRQ